MTFLQRVFSIVFVLGAFYNGMTQDTLYFDNGNHMYGEFKGMNKGVLVFETDYSDSDFKIEWKSVRRVITTTEFLITLSHGQRINGSIEAMDSVVVISTTEGQVIHTSLDDIVFLKSINDGFWSQISANIDVGFNMTKSNNLRQITVSGGVGYTAEKWSLDSRFNSLNSVQDSVDATLRNDGGVTVNIFLPKDWFVLGALDYLSNTEQLLDLRLNGRTGIGYYVAHTNSWYWGFSAGVAIIDEKYSSGENEKSSMESFVGTELNLFDIGDLNIYSKVTAYPGITEKGRFRTDFKFDLKYDLPYDFYIKGGLTVNYDNQPTVGASDVDYVLNTGIGWKW